MKKRGHNEGSVYFHEATNRWVASVSLGKDEAGKRVRKQVYGASKDEARSELKKLLASLDAGLNLSDRSRFGGYAEHFLEQVVKPTAKRGTHFTYRYLYDTFLAPPLAALELKDISTEDLERVLGKMLKEGYSAATRKMVYQLAHKIFTRAIEHRLLNRNPVASKELRQRFLKGGKKDRKPWTAEQVRVFLETCKGRHGYELFLTAIDTGLRVGELVALEWKHVDLTTGAISVELTQSEVPGEIEAGGDRFERTDPKSEAGKRVVFLSKPVVEVLKAFRVASGAISGRVFRSSSGRPYYRRHVRRLLIKRAEEAGVPPITTHTLRHTNASLLAAVNTPPKAMAERLGHSDVAFTLETYVHTTEEQNRAAAETMGKIYGGGKAGGGK